MEPNKEDVQIQSEPEIIPNKKGEINIDFKKITNSLVKAPEKFIDFIFSKDPKKWIVLLLIIGIILRILLANHLTFNADEMVHGTHTTGFIGSGKLQIMDQDAVWFWLTDFFTNILGGNLIGLRFMSILFGSLSIILIYLLGKEIFNKKIAMIAAFIFTFSSYQLIEMRAEMDIAMAFFAILAMYLLILFYKTDKNKLFVLAWISIGIAIMIKQIALLFIPAFVLYGLLYNKQHHKSFRLNQVIYAAIIIVLMVTPVLTYNYLLYQDKGLLDVQFARFFGDFCEKCESHYASISHTMKSFEPKYLFVSRNENKMPGLLHGLSYYNQEALWIIPILALVGLFFFFKQKTKFTWLLVLTFLFPFVFLSGTSLLSTHFVFGSTFVALFAALGIDRISKGFNNKNSRKKFIYLILALIVILSFVQLYQHTGNIFDKNEMQELIEYKNENFEEDSIIFTDGRIYRGRTVFAFNDMDYLETNYISEFLYNMNNFPGEITDKVIYTVECVPDDCGWGTIKDQAEFNTTTESLITHFAQKSFLQKTITDTNGEPYFNIYKGWLSVPQGAEEYIRETHQWFFYPVNYQGPSFDDYVTNTFFEISLEKIAFIILYIEIILALLSIIFLFYILVKKDEIVNNSSSI